MSVNPEQAALAAVAEAYEKIGRMEAEQEIMKSLMDIYFIPIEGEIRKAIITLIEKYLGENHRDADHP